MTMTKKITASVLALAMSVNMAFVPIEKVSDFSDAFVVCSAVSYDVTAPAIPTSIKAVSEANAITLSWKKAKDAQGYRLEIKSYDKKDNKGHEGENNKGSFVY